MLDIFQTSNNISALERHILPKLSYLGPSPTSCKFFSKENFKLLCLTLQYLESTAHGWSALAGHLDVNPMFVHGLYEQSRCSRSQATILLDSFLEMSDNNDRDPIEVLEIISEKCAEMGSSSAKKFVDDELKDRRRGCSKSKLGGDLEGTPKCRRVNMTNKQVSFQTRTSCLIAIRMGKM